MLSAMILLSVASLGGDKMVSKDLTVGTGDEVRPFDVVTVDYTGSLMNGTVFDSSVGKQPFTFQVGVGSVIKGWDQGVVGMKVGGKRQLTIPPDLAYGRQGVGPIPPNSTLKFDVTVIKTERAKIETTAPGNGEALKVGDTVEVNYTGTFPDGKKFDSTLDKGRTPIMVQIGQGRMIPGFIQAMIGLKMGEKRKVTIPPSLAYGAKGRAPEIPANATLCFEIEVVRAYPKKKG